MERKNKSPMLVFYKPLDNGNVIQVRVTADEYIVRDDLFETMEEAVNHLPGVNIILSEGIRNLANELGKAMGLPDMERRNIGGELIRNKKF